MPKSGKLALTLEKKKFIINLEFVNFMIAKLCEDYPQVIQQYKSFIMFSCLQHLQNLMKDSKFSEKRDGVRE